MSEWASQWWESIDRRFPAGFYSAVSVDPDRERTRMRRWGWVFLDSPPTKDIPSNRALETTAKHWIRRSQWRFVGVGASSAALGPLSLPPEIAANAVMIIRLAQRLALTYGFDPRSGRGQLAVIQAVAAAFEVELPTQGAVDIRLSDLSGKLVKSNSRQPITAIVARAAAGQLIRSAVVRVGRWIPGLSPGLSAISAHRRLAKIGERMLTVIQQQSGFLCSEVIEDAREVSAVD